MHPPQSYLRDGTELGAARMSNKGKDTQGTASAGEKKITC